MIQAKNIRFGYRRGRKLFEEMSFELPKGTITGLLGRNGEGKTTLLKLLSGQFFVQDGSLSVLGYDPVKREVPFLADLFYLPEEVICPGVTIREYFDIITPFYPNYSPELAEEAIATFDLKWNMNLGKVSQGQKKKAIIALALSLRTSLLLMDEPTNSLDIPSKAAFRRMMAAHTTNEQTVIISTHQVRDLEQLIDRIMMLEHNRIICNEPIMALEKLFVFRQIANRDMRANALYTEPSVLGELGVFENDGSEESNFSMELFFDGMIACPDVFIRIINKQ
ncbi:ATP-binding cassette domain-containing protein [Porphyromonas macacae]|uniref:ABC transporter ATP-binding protein n=1 Tax=Porphyromonas macacae TaxID=28115 RepID=UPI0024ADFD56|nr:ABC transporter ATP-binding protein [Porphyromonas macacae]